MLAQFIKSVMWRIPTDFQIAGFQYTNLFRDQFSLDIDASGDLA